MTDGMRNHIPEISLTIKHGDSIQSGDLALESIGFGLRQCWIYSTMFGATTLFNHQNMFSGAFNSSFSLQFVVSIVFLSATLLFLGFSSNVLQDKIPPKPAIVVAGIITFAGSVPLLIPGLPLGLATVLEIASGVTTGIGSAMLIICWGVRFARRGVFTIALNSIFAIAFAYFLYSFVIAGLPYPFGGLLASLLPLLEIPILLNPPQKDFFKDSYSNLFRPLRVNKVSFLVLFGVPILIFGLAMGLLRQICIQHAADISAQSSITAITFAVAVFVARIVLFPSRDDQLGFDFRGFVPLIAVSIAFIPLANSGNAEIAGTMILIVYLCFETLMWSYFGEICQTFRISPLLVFGVGRGLLALGNFASSGLITGMRFGFATFGGEDTLILFLILTLIVAFALLPNKNSFREIVHIDSPKNRTSAPDIEFDEEVDEDVDELTAKTDSDKKPAQVNATAAESKGSVSDGGAEADPHYVDGRGLKSDPQIVEDGTATSKKAVETNGALTNVDPLPNRGPLVNHSATTGHAAPDSPNETTGHTAPTHNHIREGYSAAASHNAPLNSASPVRQGASSSNVAPARNTSHTNYGTPSNHRTPAPRIPLSSHGARADLDASRAPHNGLGSSSSPMAPTSNEVAMGTVKKKGWFRKKCEAASNLYMLSAREEEVLFYLAKGFNASHIQEKLYISEGTAKTHMRHIYRKLDVHSQQALIRLVESMEIEEDF